MTSKPKAAQSGRKKSVGSKPTQSDMLDTRNPADRAIAGLSPACSAALVIRSFSTSLGEQDIAALMKPLSERISEVQEGDLQRIDAMLYGQAAALQAIFTELARRAALNMGAHLNATEAYLKLALKAQSQCRATLETLAEIKNPRPLAFVKQANIANGHQQINNGASPLLAQYAPAHAHGKIPSQSNELLSQGTSNGTPMDTRGTTTTSPIDSEMATMATRHRAT